LETTFSFPFLEKIREMGGLEELSKRSECQKELFCNMAEVGGREGANTVQKVFGYTASLTPTFLAEMLGISDVLQASLEGRCPKFKCYK